METELPRYPTVQFLVKHGNRFALTLALLVILFGIALSWLNTSWIILAGGVVGGAVLYVILRSYVELVQIIADMLLPK